MRRTTAHSDLCGRSRFDRRIDNPQRRRGRPPHLRINAYTHIRLLTQARNTPPTRTLVRSPDRQKRKSTSVESNQRAILYWPTPSASPLSPRVDPPREPTHETPKHGSLGPAPPTSEALGFALEDQAYHAACSCIDDEPADPPLSKPKLAPLYGCSPGSAPRGTLWTILRPRPTPSGARPCINFRLPPPPRGRSKPRPVSSASNQTNPRIRSSNHPTV